MKTVPINVVGPAYEDGDYSAQSTINLFPSRPIVGRSVRKLDRWPGSKLFSTGSGACRSNAVEMDNLVYFVAGTSLVSLDSLGNQTTLGTIAGTGRCHLATDGTNVIISTGGKRYQYYTTLTEITDPDHSPGNTSDFINSRMIYDAAGGQFQVADLTDPDSINSLNFATAESAPDDTVAVKTFRERVFICGEKTIEVWYNDGSSDFPPFSRIEGSTHQFGLGAIHSLANDDSYVYLISSDRQVCRIADVEAQRFTPVAMEDFLESEKISDARGWCMSYAGQWFYCLTFPTANKSWVIPLLDPESAFQVSSDLSRGRHLADAYIYAFGKHLVVGYSDSSVYALTEGEYQDAGNNVLVERTLAPLNAEAFGAPGNELCINEFEMVMESGVGNVNVTDPVGIFDFSSDNGNSYTNEKWVKLGQDGIKQRVKYYLKQKFYDGAVRFRVVDPVNVSLHSAAAKLKMTGEK